MSLHHKVIDKDRRLELAASGAAEALMAHRWHWTLDDSNARRVSLTEYARAVGRSVPTIRRDSQGHISLVKGESTTVTEARTRATMSKTRLKAAEAVAKAEGISLKTARERPQTKHVETAVRNGKGTARQVAERMAAETRKRTEGTSTKYVQALKQLDAARLALFRLLTLAHVNEWESDEAEAIKSQLTECNSIIDLTALALTGALTVDWDAAMEALSAGTPAHEVEAAVVAGADEAEALTGNLMERVRRSVSKTA